MALAPMPTSLTHPGGGGGGSGPASGLSGAQLGVLRSLLGMGQLEGVVGQVDGLLAQRAGGPPGQVQLSAAGIAAAWRLGRWPLLRHYLATEQAGEVTAGTAGLASLGPSEEWEVQLGYVLSALQVGCELDGACACACACACAAASGLIHAFVGAWAWRPWAAS